MVQANKNKNNNNKNKKKNKQTIRMDYWVVIGSPSEVKDFPQGHMGVVSTIPPGHWKVQVGELGSLF